ncbi:MAG: recombinase family protein [Anaerolineae bacterium]|jgi:hypothetical protein|nr:recombinase family protein [Anaerolineae bacterium]
MTRFGLRETGTEPPRTYAEISDGFSVHSQISIESADRPGSKSNGASPSVDVLSEKTPQRAAYQRLLGDARLGKLSHVVVDRADRFGCNDTEALRAIDELHEFGVKVVFANQPDLDSMVARCFTLAHRESALLGIWGKALTRRFC